MRDILIYFTSPVVILAALLFFVMLYFLINRPKEEQENPDGKTAVTTEDLRAQMNRERQKEGLHQLPALNSKSGGNGYARLDKSFKSAPDFYRQLLKKKK